MTDNKNSNDSRRDFLKNVSVAGCGLFLGAPSILGHNPLTNSFLNHLNFGIIGFGAKGYHAFKICNALPNIKFRAVCDINPKRRHYAREVMANKHQISLYENYQEMIDREQLDAVIINTPDIWHARQTICCMKQGIHVYCEKTMAFNQEEAKEMVTVARKTGMKLQLGHQRRSSTNYMETFKMAHENKLFGRLTHAVGQWNRSSYGRRAWKEQEIGNNTLKEYGFNSYDEYANWRCYKSVSNGIIADLGAHQLDIYSWFFQANPHRILISGSRDYYSAEYTDHEDNVFVILEYNTPIGPARASYEVISNSSALGHTERIIGDQGAAVLSLQTSKFRLYRESQADKEIWNALLDQKRLTTFGNDVNMNEETYVDETAPQIRFQIGKKETINPFTAHIQNFTEAIAGNEDLHCNASEAYRTELPIFQIAQALRDKKNIITIDEREYII